MNDLDLHIVLCGAKPVVDLKTMQVFPDCPICKPN